MCVCYFKTNYTNKIGFLINPKSHKYSDINSNKKFKRKQNRKLFIRPRFLISSNLTNKCSKIAHSQTQKKEENANLQIEIANINNPGNIICHTHTYIYKPQNLNLEKRNSSTKKRKIY